MSGGELAQSGCYCIQAVIFCHLTNGAQISTSTHATSMGGSLTQQSPDFVKDPPKGFYPYPYMNMKDLCVCVLWTGLIPYKGG